MPTATPSASSLASGEWATQPPHDDVLFVEFFAGEGRLSSEVAKAGVPTWAPNDVATGGTDFTSVQAVEDLRSDLLSWSRAGAHLVLHFAPPCATFSRARDRSQLTRLRSPAHVSGLPGCEDRVAEANLIADRTKDLAEWAAAELKAVVTIETPESSYLWDYWGKGEVPGVKVEDITFSQCHFGTAYRKNTRLRCYNETPTALAKKCAIAGDHFTCGISRAEGHRVLEFGGEDTQAAAAYPEELCKQWAKVVVDWRCSKVSSRKALGQVRLVQHGGKVRRHKLRGPSDVSTKELREQENQNCLAGMRNAATVVRAWPKLVEVMEPIAEFLGQKIDRVPGFQGLAGCCGSDPVRPPPSETLLSLLRSQVADLLGLTRGAGQANHEAAPWKYEIIEEVGRRAEDPDVHLATWLKDGAPMGLAEPIAPGGLFPEQKEAPDIEMEELAASTRWDRNHPSFSEDFGRERPPGLDLLEEYLEEGFAELYENVEVAEQALGAKLHPAPLGTIGKEKPDGSWKFRVIQDQRRNDVNAAVRLPERQVLPRPLDYAKDLALHSRAASVNEKVKVLVLDFASAFMSIPLHPRERPYNVTVVDKDLCRKRSPIREGEPQSGTCLVWRVLGFGGKPNPLVYSRVASFAARTAQALIGVPNRRMQKGTGARGRLQMYVDDPILSVSGSEQAVDKAIDSVILWWLVLGVPLSWKKGMLVDAKSKHTWIGVDFMLRDGGVSAMTLPDKFAKELAEQLSPFCSLKGHSSRKDAEIVVGRVARVAHVIAEARPFSSALWTALTESDRAHRAGQREAPPGRVAHRRFSFGARWVKALLEGSPDAPFLLEREVRAEGPKPASLSSWSLATDASPWGGGAVLLHDGVPMEYTMWNWQDDQVEHLGVVTGVPAHQTFWEFFCVALALTVWAKNFTSESLALLCDNTAALQNALDMKGSGAQLEVAQELAWRRARGRWAYEPGHLPSQQNVLADALSRLAAPDAKEIPAELKGAILRTAPDPKLFWKLRG